MQVGDRVVLGGEEEWSGRFQWPSGSWNKKAKTSKKERKWQRGIVVHPLSESQWNRGHFSMRKWEF